MRTLRGSRSVCLRETALTLTVVGVEGSMLRGQNHKEKKIKIDIFRKFGINLGINVGASSELRSMGCLPPPHSDSGSPLSDRGSRSHSYSTTLSYAACSFLCMIHRARWRACTCTHEHTCACASIKFSVFNVVPRNTVVCRNT